MTTGRRTVTVSPVSGLRNDSVGRTADARLVEQERLNHRRSADSESCANGAKHPVLRSR